MRKTLFLSLIALFVAMTIPVETTAQLRDPDPPFKHVLTHWLKIQSFNASLPATGQKRLHTDVGAITNTAHVDTFYIAAVPVPSDSDLVSFIHFSPCDTLSQSITGICMVNGRPDTTVAQAIFEPPGGVPGAAPVATIRIQRLAATVASFANTFQLAYWALPPGCTGVMILVSTQASAQSINSDDSDPDHYKLGQTYPQLE